MKDLTAGMTPKYICMESWIGSENVLVTASTQKVGDDTIYMIYQDPYTKMVAYPSGDSRYYQGQLSDFTADKWDKATPITGENSYKILFDVTSVKPTVAIDDNAAPVDDDDDGSSSTSSDFRK